MSTFNEVTIKLRSMLIDDLPEVLTIENSRNDLTWSEDTFFKCIEAGFKCLVLEINKKIIAYAVILLHKDEAHLLNISVSKQEQRKGYGSYIIHHLFSMARSNKIRKIILKAREGDSYSYKFYLRLGFLSTKRLKNYYGSSQNNNNALVLEYYL